MAAILACPEFAEFAEFAESVESAEHPAILDCPELVERTTAEISLKSCECCLSQISFVCRLSQISLNLTQFLWPKTRRSFLAVSVSDPPQDLTHFKKLERR